MSFAIAVQDVTKSYRLGAISSSTLHGDISRWWARKRGKADPHARVGDHPRQVGDQFLALNGVSFEVRDGDVVGLIGRNGAGKSTLLKIMSRVTAPTAGQIRVRGRIASLLEVGTGFHPDLTGRENVFLNGAILGMTSAEIRRKFDEIVAFSECERFIDTPVKRYSSGMYVRLAFAVAAHLEPEILIVDEVLAVGDTNFQQKCLGKMRDVSRHGRTILFVSHNLAAISALCSRAVLLDGGRVALDGTTQAAIDAYQFAGASDPGKLKDLSSNRRTGTGRGRFTSLRVTSSDADGRELKGPVPGCELSLEVGLKCEHTFAGAQVAAIFFDAGRNRIIDLNTALHGAFVSMNSGEATIVRFRLHDVLLKPGQYYVWLWLGRGALEELDFVEDAATLQMFEPAADAKHSETFPGVYQCRFTHEIAPAAQAVGTQLVG